MEKKLREQLYRDAAEKIFNDDYEEFCCNAMEHIKNRKIDFEKECPEFYLFHRDNVNYGYAWWDDAGNEREPRIIALLLSAEMCKSGGKN